MDTVADSTEWSMEGFVNEFANIHNKMTDRAFAFILGAGASYPHIYNLRFRNDPSSGRIFRRYHDTYRA